MNNGIYAASTGLLARTQELDLAAHNLANANTTGFRGEHVSFKSQLMNASSDASSRAVSSLVTDSQLVTEPKQLAARLQSLTPALGRRTSRTTMPDTTPGAHPASAPSPRLWRNVTYSASHR